MICKPCADAADGKGPEGPALPHCPDCGRHIQVNVAWTEAAFLVYHKRNGKRCPGVNKDPVYRPAWNGHDNCTGCDCHHQPVGSHLAGAPRVP